MILRLFQTNVLFGYVLVYVVTAILLGLNISDLRLEENLFLSKIFGTGELGRWIVGLLIIAALPVSVVSFFRFNQIHKKSTFFQYFLFLLLTYPMIVKSNWLSLITIPMVVGVLHQFMQAYNQTNSVKQAVAGGLILSVASCIEPVIVIGIPFFYLMLAVFRSLNLLDFIQFLIGFITPILLLFGLDVFGVLGIEQVFISFFSEIQFGLPYKIFFWSMVPGGLFALIAFFNLLTRVNFLSIRQQLNRYALIWLAIVSVFFLFLEGNTYLGFFSLALSICVPMNYYFKTIKSPFWSDVQILLIIGVSGYFVGWL